MQLIYGLTYLGVFHTLLSLIAVVTGAIALTRDGKISWNNSIGKVYVISTIVVCLTGFGIFQHGGFGKPHVLGIITLVTLGVIWAAANNKLGKRSIYIETIGYSLTFFFHIVPGITESLTRLPYGAPIATGPEDPLVQKLIGVCFVLFVIGAVIQARKMSKSKN
ncbi:MAG: hypothetical protein QM734_05435 [Cyclobacteriaceae bacterium]